MSSLSLSPFSSKINGFFVSRYLPNLVRDVLKVNYSELFILIDKI